MTMIRPPAPLNKNDTRNKYLKILRYTPTAAAIDAVQPVRPALNQLYDPKPDFMYSIDTLYQHADDMLEAYRRLSAQEKKSRDMMKRYSGDPEGFLAMVKELVKHFNQTTATVLTFDRVFHTHHSEVLADMLGRQQFTLELVGIRIVGINQLEFDGSYFRKAAREKPDFFTAVFSPGLGLFDKVFGYVRSIQIP